MLTIQDLERIPGMPALSRTEYVENLATHRIAVAPDGTLHRFDTQDLCFYPLSGLSNCKALMTTKRR